MSLHALDETLLRRWTRRALTVPLFLLLLPVWLITLPLTAIAAAVVDVASNGRFLNLRALAFVGVYFACEWVGIVASFFIWLASGVWAGGSRERFLDWNFRLQTLWGSTLARFGLRLFGIRLHVEGEESCDGGPVLLFIRHASLADTVLAVATLAARHGLRLRYVLKHRLLWDPCLDIVGQRLPNWFVRHGTAQTSQEIEHVARLADGLGPLDGVLIYPEGTRYSEAKRQRVLEGLERRGDEGRLAYARRLRHVLPPRQGGPTALLERNATNGSRADVLFCAHTGFEGSATMRQIANGELLDRDVYIRFWRVPYDEIPTESAARDRWLLGEWRKTDDFVDSHLPLTYRRTRRGVPG